MKNLTLFFVLFLVAFLSVETMAQTDFWEKIDCPPANQGALAISESGDIFIGSGTAVYRSTDNGATWTESNSGLDLLVWNFAFYSRTIYAAGHGLFRSTDNGLNWIKISDAVKISGLAVNDSGHIFTAWGNETGSGFERSSDNGVSWINIAPESYRDIAINPAGTIFTGGPSINGACIFRSIDKGKNWTKIDMMLGNLGVYELKISEAGNIFGVLSPSYDICCSTDNGDHWISINAGISTLVTRLAINSSGHIFAGTYDSGVYRSNDDGETWTTVNSGLTNDYVLAIGINPSGTVFAATTGGLFRSVQSTTSVRELSTDAPISFSLNQNYPNPFNPSTTIRFQVPNSSFVNLKVYDVLGNEVATLVNEEKATGSYEVSFKAANLSSGVYLYKLQAGSFVEINKMLLLK